MADELESKAKDLLWENLTDEQRTAATMVAYVVLCGEEVQSFFNKMADAFKSVSGEES